MLKIGDRVIYINIPTVGEGIIVDKSIHGPGYWWVDFDKDHKSGFDANGKGRMGHCYTTSGTHLEKLPDLSPFDVAVRAYIQSELGQ